jgi:peptidylprolyl isomerase/FKBP-type peptidyl-prolyl cis-trans isomerase FklB
MSTVATRSFNKILQTFAFSVESVSTGLMSPSGAGAAMITRYDRDQRTVPMSSTDLRAPVSSCSRGRLLIPVALSAALALGACAETGLGPATRSAAGADPLSVGAPGVVALGGLRYRVLKSGAATGSHPRRSDEIVVRYEGRLTNGRVFDSSASDKSGTATFPLGKLIPGWVAALQLMRPGDEWLIHIPSYLAYGEKGVGPIPANADLVFKVELVSIKPAG